MNTFQKLYTLHLNRAFAAATVASALALALTGCGGGGGDSGTTAVAPPVLTPDPAPAPVQTTAALQGIWQSPAGADQSITAIVLPDGQLWSVVSSAGVTRLITASLAAQTAGFGGSGKSYTLGGNGATNNLAATVGATVVEKTSLAASITVGGSVPETYALAYQSRYDTAAALADFAGNWQATLGPGILNWSISTEGVLSGTRTTGCDYSGQLALRAERKAVVDVAITENCAGTLTQLKGVAAISVDKSRISMATTTTDGVTAVVLTLAH